tara:strand:- start:12655 stop:14034 length:1380 start_codon:yes stop_codon:yes gene_type:complete
MRKLLFCFSLVSVFLHFQCVIGQSLRISENGRFIEKSNATPFFYLGDTAWELFHRLDIGEAEYYLNNRADKGFTVIQAVILSELNGISVPNANGDLPVFNKDPKRPNEAYFKHVDAIVDKASSLGLVMGMLPTWGSYWSSLSEKDIIFTAESAEEFGLFLGKRYKDKPVIWILGGDRNIRTENDRKIVEAMAQGLKQGCNDQQLITFHPRGPGMSSDYFHNAEWLDFNMYQSSHGQHGHYNGLYAEHDYALEPIKPTLDGEPRYESIPVGFYFKGTDPKDRFDDYDARQAAYWSVFAGACGHTYGNNNIWQMYSPDNSPIIGAAIPWKDALDHPGAFQMKHLKTLMEARSFSKLTPKPELIKNSMEINGEPIRAVLALDASFAMIYTPSGKAFTVDKGMISGLNKKAIWYDPRYGVSHHLGTSDTDGIQTYKPPTSGRGQDWVLILENADLNLPMPGFH